MSLDKKNLLVAFVSVLVFTVFSPTLLPSIKLFYFSAFLVLVYYQKSYLSSLWISLACGLILDLLASNIRFGLHALNFTMTTAIVYKQRWNFFADSFSTLPIMTFLFSFTSSVLQALLLYIFAIHFPLSFQWILTDIFVLPILDALFAVIWFLIIPTFIHLFLFQRSRSRGHL